MGKRDRQTTGDDTLDAREIAVLSTVVRAHIADGQPVASAAIARCSELRLSPASIRSVLGSLADRGFLDQPHRSAGRVPTDRAYRVYVDRVMRRPARVPAAEAQEIESALGGGGLELPELLVISSRQLSQRSHQVGLALAPEVRRLVVERLEFVPLEPRKVMAIVVGRSGTILHRVLILDDPIDASELERVGRYLSDDHRGRTLVEILERLEGQRTEELATFDRLRASSLALCRRALETELDEVGVIVEGASNLLDPAAFDDLDVVRTLFRTLEEKQLLIDLLGRLIQGNGVQVVIGGENPVTGLSRCTVVASGYGTADKRLGTVGVVGPMRMPYTRVIPLVGHLAAVLTSRLSSSEN